MLRFVIDGNVIIGLAWHCNIGGQFMQLKEVIWNVVTLYFIFNKRLSV